MDAMQHAGVVKQEDVECLCFKMKKIYIAIIIGILLIGLVGAVIIINKNISITGELYDYSVSKQSVYTYTEKEFSDGKIRVCVYKDGKTNLFLCRNVNAGEQDVIIKYLIEKDIIDTKAKTEYVKPIINKETEGIININREK